MTKTTIAPKYITIFAGQNTSKVFVDQVALTDFMGRLDIPNHEAMRLVEYLLKEYPGSEVVDYAAD